MTGAALLPSACHRDNRPPIPPPDEAALGRDFYPIAVGRYWVYDVQEHRWNLNRDEIARYQLRERIDTVFAGAGNEKTYLVVRSRRPDEQSAWRDDSVFTLVVNASGVRRTAANVPILELAFPVRENGTWNPNQFNGAPPLVRRYEALDQPVRLAEPGVQYERAVRVADEGENNPLFLRAQQAVYARGVGRIERTRRQLAFCNQPEVDQGLCVIGEPLPGAPFTSVPGAPLYYYIARGTERYEALRDYGPR